MGRGAREGRSQTVLVTRFARLIRLTRSPPAPLTVQTDCGETETEAETATKKRKRQKADWIGVDSL